MTYQVLHSSQNGEELYAELEKKPTLELRAEYERIFYLLPKDNPSGHWDKPSDIAAAKLLGMIAHILSART